MPNKTITSDSSSPDQYDGLLGDVVDLLAEARQTSVRSVNSLMTATYWEIGRRIVEFEQDGEQRAEYGKALVKKLAKDLKTQIGPGFSFQDVYQMRAFYLAYPEISQTVSGKLQNPEIKVLAGNPEEPAASALPLTEVATAFPLPWAHYVRLLKGDNVKARSAYETEALRGGWSIRQLDRQACSLFYERTALSTNKTKMSTEGAVAKPAELTPPGHYAWALSTGGG